MSAKRLNPRWLLVCGLLGTFVGASPGISAQDAPASPPKSFVHRQAGSPMEILSVQGTWSYEPDLTFFSNAFLAERPQRKDPSFIVLSPTRLSSLETGGLAEDVTTNGMCSDAQGKQYSDGAEGLAVRGKDRIFVKCTQGRWILHQP